MNRAGSNRVGWNARGPSAAEDFRNAVYQSEIRNPDSRYWLAKAQTSIEQLRELMGEADYAIWSLVVWPDEGYEDITWKQQHEDVQAALAAGLDAIYQTLECRCNPREDIACPACRAKQARLEMKQ